MRLLILSCHTGEGHNSAALAIAEEWKHQGEFCEVIDAMSFGGEMPQRVVSNAYNSMIVKIPEMFGRIYKAGDWFSKTKLPSPIYVANTLYAKKMLAYIVENRFDAVLCTHLFPMEALTHLKHRGLLSVPCYGVLTDYTCIPFFEETKLDTYFIPQEEVTAKCVLRGMAAEHLVTTGIPVSRSFSEIIDKAQARGQLDIPQDGKMYLIMTGGMGCGNVKELCKWILYKDSAANVYVLTGRNDALNQELTAEYGKEGQVHPVAFTKKVYVYMKAADVLLTKPGGISSTEAAVAGVPTVHIAPIPGCEIINAEFFSSYGMSVYAKSAEDAAAAAEELIRDDAQAKAMLNAQKRHINHNAAADIVAYMKGHGDHSYWL